MAQQPHIGHHGEEHDPASKPAATPPPAHDHAAHEYASHPPARPADDPTAHAHQALAETTAAHAGHGVEAGMLMDEATRAAHDAHAEHGAHVDHTGHEDLFRRRFWLCLLLSIPVLVYSPMLQMWFGFSAPAFPGSSWIGPIFALIVFAVGGVPFLQMAVPEIQQRQPGMMTLISLAISVALLYSLAALVIDPEGGFFWEMVLLIDVMLLGHWLEMRSVRQASGALGELAKLMPDTAERIRPDGSTEQVAVSALRTGDLVLVRPGANIAADGEVVEGASSVNEALITGESRPVDKEPGDRVIAGATNGVGSLRVRVTATGEATALAGIMRLVEEAQQSKSRTQVLADRAAGWLFYIALAVALLTAIGWVAATGFNVHVVERVATVLVIACPHALGLAVPLVVAISTSLAASNGILVRDRVALEEARNLDTILFDKTGTLTFGSHGVVASAVMDGMDEAAAIGLAAAVEGDSEHMIAAGVRQLAEDRGVTPPRVEQFEAIKGQGVRALHDGTPVYVGGPRLLEALEVTLPPKLQEFTTTAGSKGQTVVYLLRGRNGTTPQAVAAFALADVIRPESKLAVRRLQELGKEVAMVTGDSRAVAQAVAEELHIDRTFAEVLPESKDQQVSELQRQGKKVAMVGDGINDAPALTRADVGIAIGSGTDVAVASADIILVQSDPVDVVNVIELSQATHRKMVQNLWWATGYNIVALPLAAGVLAPWGIVLSPAVGALLMSISTIVVALNAQLLRGLRLTKGQ
ncbi:MAG: heavy metal translocating P-type ATPase [Chloroflexi bacterium]|nr:MAG: heavy metal translocating P-type ATPase [Chloroflexota bacterium]